MAEIQVPSPGEIDEELLKELRRLQDVVRSNTLAQTSLRMRFVTGVAGGFGTVIGATLVVSILIWMLKSFATIEILRPAVDEISKMVEGRNSKDRTRTEEQRSDRPKDQRLR